MTTPIEDPLVMYLVVRESLGMSPGKVAAQVGHAVQMIVLGYALGQGKAKSGEEEAREALVREWLALDYRKVVLRADEKEFEKVKGLPGAVVVVDAGHTEVATGSETVVGLWPMRRSERPAIVKRLQALA